jgi:putative oxidoreductase
MDTGLLILRGVVGLLLVGHGAQKLFGWFGGYGLRGTGDYLEGLGYRPGPLMALLAGLCEAGGGALLALGLGTPVAGAMLVAGMMNVYSGHEGKGPWNENGGWELPLVLGTVGAAVAFTGAGAYSLDGFLDADLSGNGWGAAALATGAIVGLATQLTRRRAAKTSAAQTAA